MVIFPSIAAATQGVLESFCRNYVSLIESRSVRNFHGSNYQGEDFSNANLTSANFSNTNIEGVNFTGADLTGAQLYKAKTTNANFTDATLDDANLTGCDLNALFKEDTAELTAKSVKNISAAAQDIAKLSAERQQAILGCVSAQSALSFDITKRLLDAKEKGNA